MKLTIKLATTMGPVEHEFDIPDDVYVTSMTLSGEHGALLEMPFQLEGDFYVRTLPRGLYWREMPEDK